MRYRKRPVEVQAVRWLGSNLAEVLALVDFDALPADDVHVKCPPLGTLAIPTLEGTMTAQLGDWVIRGVKGELYPCKPDIFEVTYEPVPDDPPPRDRKSVV